MSTLEGFDILTLAKAFAMAESQIGIMTHNPIKSPAMWQGAIQNAQQRSTLDSVVFATQFLDAIPELVAWADTNVDVINEKLAEKGFSIRLEDLHLPEDSFYVAAILDITLMWLTPGVGAPEYSNRFDGKPVYRLSSDEQGVRFYSIDEQTVIEIPSDHPGDVLYIVQSPEQVLTGIDLMRAGARLKAQVQVAALLHDFNGVILPNILIDVKPDLSYLANVWTLDANNKMWRIAQVLAQIKFAMNRFGARTKSSVAMSVLRESHPPEPRDYVANHHLMIVKSRDGVEQPIVTFIVPRSEFSDTEVDLNKL